MLFFHHLVLIQHLAPSLTTLEIFIRTLVRIYVVHGLRHKNHYQCPEPLERLSASDSWHLSKKKIKTKKE